MTIDEPPKVDSKIDEMPQTWLNQRQEAGYEQANDVLSALEQSAGQEGVRSVFIGLVNATLKREGKPEIALDLLSSMEFTVASSESASKIAGKEIKRPALVFTDREQYERFYGVISGHPHEVEGRIKCSSAAVSIDMSVPMPDGTQEQVRLIISSLNRDHIGHEVRHSIDPNLMERQGYDRILEELFAYYYDHILDEKEIERYRGRENMDNVLWDGLLASVWNAPDSYYKTYTENEDRSPKEKLTFEQYAALVKKAVGKIRSLSEQKGHLETQRLLAQMQTLDQLFSS